MQGTDSHGAKQTLNLDAHQVTGPAACTCFGRMERIARPYSPAQDLVPPRLSGGRKAPCHPNVIVPNGNQGFHEAMSPKADFSALLGTQAWVNPENFRIDCFQYWNS